ncbi:Kelch-like protein 12 [Cichlidogyrus casuarinus]|uniref:Kelch-like protein 12 n=1 Tax=Cichlidogyrus casuarinus TaxID=1844966 RepID=A0ABD2PSL4_9PLAT
MYGPAICTACACAVGGFVYVIGGTNDHDRLSNSTWILSIQSRIWQKGPDILRARSNASCVVVKDKIYLLGGSDDKGNLSCCEVLDIRSQNPEWRYISPMNKARSSFSVATHADCLHVFGGMIGWKESNSAEKYDPIIDSWTALPSMQVGRENSYAGVFHGKILVAGGSSTNSVEEFHPRNNTWTYLPEIPIQQTGGVMATVGENLILGGGANYRNVELFDNKKRLWTTRKTKYCSLSDVFNGKHRLTLLIQ